MTKSLKTLIKLTSKDVEAEQKVLARLQAKWDSLNQQKIDIDDSLARERLVAEKNPELSADYGSFASAAQTKLQKLAQEMRLQEEKIDMQRDILSEKFAEQKKFEIALENKELEILEEQKRKEQIMLDEIASQRHMRDIS